MTSFPGSPRLLKGGIVLIDLVSGAVLRIITLQYNPDSLSRTLQVQGVGAEGGDRSEALRLKAPPIETFKLEAELDVTDQLEKPTEGQNQMAAQLGLHPVLAALETILYPTSARLLANNSLAQAGTLEIAPMLAPLTLFVWSEVRILPVRITELSITEEAFDQNLNPIRARVSLGMRVLNVNDLGFDNKGGDLYMTYQKGKERLAAQAQAGTFGALGIGGIP
ncbi:MAG TPA: hypothetical protein VHR45_02565 [Thermoanaerobaculia bacterium]|nr:hypothetical protein [Thermoanaerobaculia bacterium]